MHGILRGQRSWYYNAAILAALAVFLTSCGQSAVRTSVRVSTGQLPRPARILVVDVSSDQARVTEYGGILRPHPENSSAAERRRELRETSANAFGRGLIDGLKRLGFTVTEVPRGMDILDDELLIDGRCLTIDQGDTVRRLVIGFGSGASKFEGLVSVYHGPEQRKLLEFMAVADSGKLPGAVVTLPAGVVIQGGLSAGLFASSAASSGISAYLSEVSQMASSSADEAVRYLSEFFASHGWIAPDQVRKARITHHSPPRSGSGPLP
jgi:hypothetical protein